MGAETAKKLLGEIAQKDQAERSSVRYRLLEQYASMSNKQKSSVEKALGVFRDIAQEAVSFTPKLQAVC